MTALTVLTPAEQLDAVGINANILQYVPPVLLALATLAVSLRFYVRALVTKGFGLDDWLLGVSWVRNLSHVSSIVLTQVHRSSWPLCAPFS